MKGKKNGKKKSEVFNKTWFNGYRISATFHLVRLYFFFPFDFVTLPL